MAGSAQKFIIAKASPRVHTEYRLALFDAAKPVQLPFVLGVLGDLADAEQIDARSIEERDFFEIDVEGFDGLKKGPARRSDFALPLGQSDEDTATRTLAYETQNDFTPDAIAARAATLRPLLEGRPEFTDLIDYMDGGAANDMPEIDAQSSALDALRAIKLPEPEEDTSGSVLDSLRATAVPDAPVEDESATALDALRRVEVAEQQVEDNSAALDALREIAPAAVEEDQSATGALDALRAVEIAPEVEDDTATAALDELRNQEIAGDESEDSGAALDALRAVELDEVIEEPATEALDALRAMEVPETQNDDNSAEVLASLPTTELAEPESEDAEAILAGIEAIESEKEEDRSEDILAGIEAVAEVEPQDTSDAILAGIEAVEDEPVADDLEDVLAGIEAPEEAAESDDLDAILSEIDSPVVDEETGTADDVLATIEITEQAEESDGVEAALAGLEAPEETVEQEDLESVLAGLEAPEEQAEDRAEDILATLDPVAPEGDDDGLDAALDGLEAPADAGTDDPLALLDDMGGDSDTQTDLDDILADAEFAEGAGAEPDDLDALLDDIGADRADETAQDDIDTLLDDVTPESDPADDALDGMLDALDGDAQVSEPEQVEEPAQDAPVADVIEEEPEDEEPSEEELQAEKELAELLLDLQPDVPDDEDDDLDALLGALDDEPEEEPAPEPPALDDLDALLEGLQDDAADQAEATADGSDTEEGAETEALLDVLAEEAPTTEQTQAAQDPAPDEAAADADDMDALLAGLETEVAEAADAGAATASEETTDMPADTGDTNAKATLSAEPELAYGAMSAERPDAQKLERKRFRIAILGDFTGRSAQGLIEVGDALAARKAILLDTDTVEDVIEGFATTLVLPIGKDGAGVEVKLGGLDDLHPDELYENVELFAALKSLKSQLGNGGTADSAAKSLVAWGEQHGRAVAPARATSGGNTVRADLKLSDFQKLIGDTEKTLAQPSPVDELMARVVGPHIRKLPDPDVTAMAGAVDDALSGAMRMVLHHPEFQSVEAQWRALDLIARSIETDDTLEVMLYDISAEEIAADLTQSDDLSTSGLVRLLTEGPMDEEFGRGAYSAMMGMYTFEETPPHAQLLGRIARVAAHVDAPFFAAITPGFIETAKQDRHPLVATEWDTLRAMPEAGHLALATPRFLMRRPYGAKTEPIYEFDFEEFTQSAGLSGMLWANPVVLVAILLAKSFKENGPSMGLGQIMSLGDMPYHFVLDRYGDQVALPCTERNLTLDKVETVLGRGYLPVVSIKGRDEIRLASFQSLGGGEILGPWSGAKPPPPSAPKPPKAVPDAMDGNDNDTAGDDADLDDLLSGFDLDAGDSDEDIDNDEDMDAELAALLADL
ncbi:type VI secretion system contractile sheath domain-containing protein [Sulfitobacter geojensis]|uniref:type VI secretion system contractile sheath domain-containing protein n=1 Tax=Sulfitobacter geojensis TaxID=1342299 RepID=UPI0004693A78|nr:type VI secretion system contractile sheath large subunit [Sulfitobacter geojensis]KHA50842.1 putative cytoplasmic protein [Sulfitobacter geojensis]NYI26782.1 type VI secretion system ImpB/VipA family protein [Sulfitobacter geojensis]